jgi:hypothetical protein
MSEIQEKDAEIARLKAEQKDFERKTNALLASMEAATITIKRLKDPEYGVDPDTYQTMNEIYIQQITRRSQIIRELLEWIADQLPIEQYLEADERGRALWDRASEAIE